MPEISMFYRIIIYMFYNDHQPLHFHARYQDYSVLIEFETDLVKGEMPVRALKLVFERLDMHKEDLLDNWQKAILREPLKKLNH